MFYFVIQSSFKYILPLKQQQNKNSCVTLHQNSFISESVSTNYVIDMKLNKNNFSQVFLKITLFLLIFSKTFAQNPVVTPTNPTILPTTTPTYPTYNEGAAQTPTTPKTEYCQPTTLMQLVMYKIILPINEPLERKIR